MSMRVRVYTTGLLCVFILLHGYIQLCVLCVYFTARLFYTVGSRCLAVLFL